MLCDIARNLDTQTVERIRALEQELGLTIVAFSCRSLDPQREQRLRETMEGLPPVLQADPADADADQLGRIRQAEELMGLSLVAVRQ